MSGYLCRGAFSRRTLLGAASASLLSAPAIAHAQGKASGAALVIGNSKYQWEAQLPNVKRDAPDVARRFQEFGLKVDLVQDAGRDAMRQAIERFSAASRGAPLAALYFAGHGASWEKDTFLVPVDADLGSPSTVRTLLPVSAVTESSAGAARRLLIFDSCRNNPADGWRQREAQRSSFVSEATGGGSAQPPNTLVLYSTASGRVALDGPAGENSPFAAALLRQLEAPSVDLRVLGPRLRRDLLIATEGRQVLWDENSYGEPFALNGPRGKGAASRSAWARDPSSVIELVNVYAHARETNTPLPEGLIAHRAPAGSPDGQKVGSFRFVVNGRTGGRFPMVLVVMSVEEQRTAQVVLAGCTDKGRFWNFIAADISRGRIEFQPLYGYPTFSFAWSDANSGTMSLTGENQSARSGGAAFSSTPFTRLDG